VAQAVICAAVLEAQGVSWNGVQQKLTTRATVFFMEATHRGVVSNDRPPSVWSNHRSMASGYHTPVGNGSPVRSA